jgi:tRNA (guanine-N7-)-methyltransferase
MSTKNKIGKFKENETFKCLFQPATEELLSKEYKYRGKWGKELFGNDNPIVLELGCGKGEYTVSLAMQYPDKNFIGIDIKGARLWKGAKFVTEKSIGNALFIRTRIEFIESLFGENEISEIWITFADPQIKRARKRLTGTLFLNRYRNFLKPDGIIRLKTDSLFLYKYTEESAHQNRFSIIDSSEDIYGEKSPYNPSAGTSLLDNSLSINTIYNNALPEELKSIKTFYESYYLKNGFKIKYLSFLLNGNNTISEPKWDEEYWEKEEAKGREKLLTNKGV